MKTREIIDLFLHDKNLAIAGVSHNPKKFGHILFKTALEKGYIVTPINPGGGTIEGISCLKSVNDIGDDIHNLLISTHKRDTAKVMSEAIARGIRNIWIQNGCETEEAIRLANENSVNLVSKMCFLMYAWPTGFHKFHQTLNKWFGRYIKENGEVKMAI